MSTATLERPDTAAEAKEAAALAADLTPEEPKQSILRVSVSRDDLAKALAVTSRGVAGRTTLPVLSNVLLAAETGTLRVSATNLEVGISTTITTGAGGAGGALTVAHKLLSDFVGTLAAGLVVELESVPKTSTLKVACGRNRATIKGIAADEFPQQPVPNDVPAIVLPAAQFRKAVVGVSFAAARNEFRPVLTGVWFNTKRTEAGEDGANILTLAAADGFRLAVLDEELHVPAAEEINAIIPARSLNDVAKLATTGDVAVYITKKKGQALFVVQGETGETVCAVRLLEGQYPDLARVIPKTSTTQIVADRQSLVAAVKRAALFSRDAADLICLQAQRGEENDPSTGKLAISGRAAEVGEQCEELDAVVAGDAAEVAFSSQYLADALAAITASKVSIGLNGGESPVLVRGFCQDDATYVLMPMRNVK